MKVGHSVPLKPDMPRGLYREDVENDRLFTIQPRNRRLPISRVYCARKIGPNDWRHDLLPMLSKTAPNRSLEDNGLQFVGPSFVNDAHGTSHGPASHGCADSASD